MITNQSYNQHDSRVMYPFIPNRLLSKFLKIKPSNQNAWKLVNLNFYSINPFLPIKIPTNPK